MDNSATRSLTPEKKDLSENEMRYRDIFEHATVAIWEEDFSQVKVEVDKLRETGVTDFRSYFHDHPEFVERALKLVSIIEANRAMLELYNAKDKADVLGSLDRFASPANFLDELVAFTEGVPSF